MTEQDLNEVIAGFREALHDYVKGDPEPAMSFFSDHDDVTLANPLEPPHRGPAKVGEAARWGRRRTSKRAVHRTSKRCSGVRTACGRSPTAPPTRSPLHD